MLNDEILEKVIERLTNKIEQSNTYVLEQIGKSIKKIGTLSPSKAHQLGQILKYGGDYEKITKKLAEVTQLNVNDIKKIFEEVAKSDYQFAKQFYEYRNKKFIPYQNNMLLKTQVDALANITANEYVNFSRTLAFTKVVNGKTIVTPLAQAYIETIDKAILSVSQGKESFNSQMYSTLKELASSGLKTVNYASGKTMRLDSAVRMHMRGALRTLHNQEQEILGKEFEADGVEISVHLNPAPDHALVQGKQFSNEEFNKFQNDQDSYSYDNMFFSAEYNGHDRRAISELNCYHYIFPIILGVSKPEYTNEQLQAIINNNNKGFTFDGKHYTNYEGTQLQRQIETEIRRQKDIQTIAKASGNAELVGEAQKNITTLTNKYRELNKASGLPAKMERMRVSDYRRTALEKVTKEMANENKTSVVVNSLQPTKLSDSEYQDLCDQFEKSLTEKEKQIINSYGVGGGASSYLNTPEIRNFKRTYRFTADNKQGFTEKQLTYQEALNTELDINATNIKTSDPDFDKVIKFNYDIISYGKEELTNIDKIIETKGISLDKDILVFRKGHETLEDLKNGVVRYGYTSVSSRSRINKITPGGLMLGENEFEIIVPAGMKFLPVKNIVPEDVMKQYEIILPRNLKLDLIEDKSIAGGWDYDKLKLIEKENRYLVKVKKIK